MSEAHQAVFLSYASQDAEAARRICDALRAAGVEVWFDQSELVGGDQWDAKIRGQISSCALFVPIISAATQARLEGYFRIEWKLAARRTHAMAAAKAFLFPVVIDATRDAEAHVPDEFREVQWTKLPGGETPAAFVARVKTLLGGTELEPGRPRPGNETHGGVAVPPSGKHPRWLAPVIAGGVIALLALIFSRPWEKAPPASVLPPAVSQSNPPPASAVPAARPSEARQLVAKAWVLLNKPEMARAELDAADALCKRAAALDATDAEVWAAWAYVNVWYCFHNLDRSAPRQEAAREYASRAMQLDPKSYEARLAQAFYWARGEANSRRLGEAQSLLRELLRERPDEPRALFTLGYMLDYPAETEAEGAALLERLARNPGFAAVAWDEIGWAAYFKGDWVKAEAAIAQSLAAQPYWNNLGLKITMAERVHGDMDLAESALKQMPASALQEDWGIGFACEVYQWRREPLRTIEVLEGVSRDWIHYFFYDYPKAYLLGEARMMAKQTGAARRDFQRARVLIEKQLADDPNNGPLLGLQARTLLYLGEKEEAEKSYRLVKELGGTDYLQIWFAPPEAAIAFIRSMADAPRGDVIERTFFSAASLRLDPQFDRLRPEPAFEALLTELEARNKPAAPSPSPLSLSPSTPPDLSTGALAKVDAKSVAVLAFANLSDDKGNEYFSDGISEELLNVLAKVPGLKVTARTSSFHFKGKDTPIPEIARQLGVAYVIEGSVRKAGGKVRITAQLIRANDGFQMWSSNNFDRELKDIFAVQDEIAGLIANQLSLKLGASSAAATASVNPQALEFYLQASEMMRLRDTIYYNTDRVEELLNRALALEPNFARAHAMLAEIWAGRGSMQTSPISRFSQRHSPERARIEAKARQAIALDPTAPEPHVALSLGMWTWWDRAGAENELRTALSLNPSHVLAHRQLGLMAMDDGRMDDAIAETRLAVQLDPLSQGSIESFARVLHVAGRYTEAIATYDRALALADSEIAREHKAYALAQHGQKEAAVALARSLTLEALRFRPFAAAGAQAEAEKILSATEPQNRAYYLFMLGRTEEGLAALIPDEMQSTYLHDVLFEPWYDPVREDPRFRQFLETLGVTDAHARAQAWRKAHPPEKPEAK